MKKLKSFQEYSGLFLRWGMALTLLWSVKTKLTATDQVVNVFGNVGLPASGALVTTLAVVLTVVALMLILNWHVHWAGLFLSLFFLVTLLLAFNMQGLAVWKDVGLLGASLALMLSGGSGGCKLCGVPPCRCNGGGLEELADDDEDDEDDDWEDEDEDDEDEDWKDEYRDEDDEDNEKDDQD